MQIGEIQTKPFPLSIKHLIMGGMPTWILALSYWLHLLATVAWIGGLLILAVVVWPGLNRVVGDNGDILDRLEKGFRPLANISLVVLLITGFLQMDENPYYEGLLVVSNEWSIALLLKHIVYAVMVIVSIVLQWGVQPALARARLLSQHNDADSSDETRLRRRVKLLATINLGLGLIVLLLTALMTAI
jgi:uncharacterized membrane protein